MNFPLFVESKHSPHKKKKTKAYWTKPAACLSTHKLVPHRARSLSLDRKQFYEIKLNSTVSLTPFACACWRSTANDDENKMSTFQHLTIPCLINHRWIVLLLMTTKEREWENRKIENPELCLFLTSEEEILECVDDVGRSIFTCSLLPLQILLRENNASALQHTIQHNKKKKMKGVECWFAAGKSFFCGMMKAIGSERTMQWCWGCRVRVNTKLKKKKNSNWMRKCLMFRLSLSTFRAARFFARKQSRAFSPAWEFAISVEKTRELVCLLENKLRNNYVIMTTLRALVIRREKREKLVLTFLARTQHPWRTSQRSEKGCRGEHKSVKRESVEKKKWKRLRFLSTK